MLEYHTHYGLGKKTFFFFFLSYGWWMTILGVLFLYFTFYFYFFTYSSEFFGFPREMIFQLSLALGLMFILFALLRTYIYHGQYKFYLDEDALHYKEGVFRIREVRIPYFQISNVEIERPYHYRLVGLAKVDVIMGSGSSHFQVGEGKRKHLIPMIDGKRAKHLAKHIIKHSTNGFRGNVKKENTSQDEETEVQ